MRRELAILCLAAGLLAAALPGVGQEVVLPLGKYEELRKQAAWAPEPTPRPQPPAPYTLETSEILIRAGTASAEVVQEIDLVLYEPGWQDIALPAMGRLVAARLGTLEGRLGASDSAWSLHVRGAGRHRIHLESAVGLTRDETATRPAWSLSVPLPPAAAVTGVLEASPEVTNVVFVNGALSGKAGAPHRWPFTGSPGRTLEANLLGEARAIEPSLLPLRFTGVAATLSEVLLTRHRVRGWVRVDVVQGELSEVFIGVPAGFEVLSVTGSAIAGWDLVDGRIKVTPALAGTSRLDLEIKLSGEPHEKFPSPLLTLPSSLRTLTATAVTIEGDGILEVVSEGSARPPSDSERNDLPPDMRASAPSVLVVSDPGRPPEWSVTRAETTEVLSAQIDTLLVDVLLGQSGQAAYQCWVTVRNRGATNFALAPPPGFELTGAGRDGLSLVPGASGSGLVLPLTGSSNVQALHLAGILPLGVPQGAGTLEVPVPALSAPVSVVQVRLLLPGDRTYELPQGRTVLYSLPSGPWQSSGRRAQGKASGLAETLGETGVGLRYEADLFAAPPGHVSLIGSWNALTATPDPLPVQVKPVEGRASKWF